MIRELLQRLLISELSKYGHDDSGNLVISPGTLDDVAAKITDSLHKAVERPVVTVSINEIYALASRAGFKVTPFFAGGVQQMKLQDRSGSIEQLQEVQRLVDFTIQHTMNKVYDQTKVKS